MTRRNCSYPNAEKEVDDPKVDAFLAEIAEVCRKHGLSIGHEDGHGAFIVEPWSEANEHWLGDAFVDLAVTEGQVTASEGKKGGGK